MCHLQWRQPYKIRLCVSTDTQAAYNTTLTHECVTFDLACTLFVFEDGPERQKGFSLSYACQWI